MDARSMQISFENRLQQISPNLALSGKLSSDIVFEFLNAAMLRFCKDTYTLEDQTEDGSRAFRVTNDALKGLSTRVVLPVNKPSEDESTLSNYTVRVKLPDNFMYYIRSASKVTQSYKSKDPTEPFVTPNKVIKAEQIGLILTTYYNKPILVNPYAVLTESHIVADNLEDPIVKDPVDSNLYLNIVHDAYTTITDVDLYYYRRPRKFDVIGVDGETILDHCELAPNVHMQIVELAIQMYLDDSRSKVAEQDAPQQQRVNKE